EKLFNYVKEKKISLIISTHEIQEVMPWLDRIIVLKEGRLIQNDSPQETYHHPYNDYVARLFGDVNVISDEQKSKLNLHKSLWYPHEIIVDHTGTDAVITESRFAGSHYWNRMLIMDIPFVVYSKTALSGTQKIRFVQPDSPII